MAKEKSRVKRLLELAQDDFVRLVTTENTLDPFLREAITRYQDAEEAAAQPELNKVEQETRLRQFLKTEENLTHQVEKAREALRHRVNMLQGEMETLSALREMKKDDLHDLSRKRAQYDMLNREYERSLKAGEMLQERLINRSLDDTNPSRVLLKLENTSLADAMAYALQLCGMSYRAHKNTVAIGAPADLESLR